MRKLLLAAVVAISWAVLYAAPVCAQGDPPYLNDQVIGGTGGKFEKVDLTNGGVNLSIPIVRIKGRGVDFTYTVSYTSKIWYVERYPVWPYNDYWTLKSPWRTQTTAGFVESGPNEAIIQTCPDFDGNPLEIWGYSNLLTTFSDGSQKQFPLVYVDVPDCFGGGPYTLPYQETYSSDGSGVYHGGYIGLHLPDGSQRATQVYGPHVDPNGNQITAWFAPPPNNGYDYTDSVGRVVLTERFLNGGTTTRLTFADGQVITLTYAAVPASTAFVNPVGVQNCTGPYCAVGVLSRIDLPNGRAWLFEYASNSYGQLTKVTLPTGGYVRYTYTIKPQFSPPTGYWSFSDALVVTGRYESADGITESPWTYAWSYTEGERIVTQTNPDANTEIHTSKTTLGSCSSTEFYETDVEYKQGASTLTRVHKDWACDTVPMSAYASDGSAGVDWGIGNVRVSDETTTIYEGANSLTKKVHYDYDQSLTDCAPTNAYSWWSQPQCVNYTASFENITRILEYDWGPGATPGPLLRQTENTYLTTNPANGNINYLAKSVHIVNKLKLQVIKDAAGNIKAQTEYEYDGGTLGTTSGVPHHDYVNYPASNRTRGNLTKVKRWRNTDGAWLTTTNTYNDLGNLLTTTDPGTHQITFSFADDYSDNVARNSQAYVTRITYPITNGVTHIERKRYYYTTGLVYKEINQNNSEITYTYDNMLRLTTISLPDGGLASYSFNDPTNPPKVTTTQRITSALNLVVDLELDGLGRTRKTKLVSDPQGAVFTRILYDGVGRKWKEWNPTRCDPDVTPDSCTGETTFGKTEYNYDALSRVTKVIPPDGSATSNNVQTTYSLNAATVIDQAGKKRRSETDGLGRLARVLEPNSGGNFIYETNYQYDVLENITRVDQKGSETDTTKWRTRTFAFDSLSRLITTTNPESGTVCFGVWSGGLCVNGYDADGNLISKTDARGVTINYNPSDSPIDALHRITKKTYSNGDQAATFTYDLASVDGLSIQYPVGRVVKATQGNTRTVISYDQMGRIAGQWQCTPVNCGTAWFATTYHYNLLGRPDTQTNPFGTSGFTLTNSYDAAGRLTQVSSSMNDAEHPGNLMTVDPTIGFHPSQTVKQRTFGNGLLERVVLNSRLQPCRITLYASGTPPSQCADSAPSGNWLDFSFGFNLGSADNGNVLSWSSSGKQTFTRNYVYDELNRISSMSGTGGGCTGMTWTYDVWANRTNQTTAQGGGSCAEHHPTILPSNRIAELGYDAAGNVTSDPAISATYTYDAENRMTGSSSTLGSAVYLYDATGHRVRKTVGIATITDFIYDATGNIIAERRSVDSGANWSWAKAYIYANGNALTLYDNTVMPNTTNFVHKDHLGSTHLLSRRDALTNPNPVVECESYQPFGELDTSVCTPLPPPPNGATTHKFTGKERDTESNLDLFGARYYSSLTGRFQASDPVALSDQKLGDPQELNGYPYARNNPLRYLDPNGEDVRLADLSEEDRTALIKDLEETTGLVLDYDSTTGNLVIVRDSGQTGYSQTARLDLIFAVSSTDTYNVINAQSYEGQNVAFGVADPGTNTIGLNFKNFDTAKRNNPNTQMTLGVSFAHELGAHLLRQLKDENWFCFWCDSSVKYENRVRQELGMYQRQRYDPYLASDGKIKLAFYKNLSNGMTVTKDEDITYALKPQK